MPFAVFLTMIACDAKLRIEFFFQTNSIVWKRRIIRTHTLTHIRARPSHSAGGDVIFTVCVCVCVPPTNRVREKNSSAPQCVRVSHRIWLRAFAHEPVGLFAILGIQRACDTFTIPHRSRV